MKFKPGDVVKRINTPNGDIQVGDIGIVTELRQIRDGFNIIVVDNDGVIVRFYNGNIDYNYNINLELVKSKENE